MKYRSLQAVALLACVVVPFVGCDHERAHTETDRPGVFGGRVHKETTVTDHSDGTSSVKQEKSVQH